jgi:putative PIN family toxin of toxin-antitoxin system
MRLVLDTGVVLSALLFPNGRLTWIADAWRDGRLRPLVDAETISELLRTLTYPKFHLEQRDIEIVLSAYLPWTEAVAVRASRTVGLPRCRDADDQKFLDLALTGKAAALVSSDKKLLELSDEVPFDVLTPAQLRQWLGST